MPLYHNYIVLLCGIVDVLLNGVPSDDPFLFFIISECFISHFIILFLNETDVSKLLTHFTTLKLIYIILYKLSTNLDYLPAAYNLKFEY